MSCAWVLRVGTLTQKLRLLSVTEKAIFTVGYSSSRQLHCLASTEVRIQTSKDGRFLRTGISSIPNTFDVVKVDYSTSFFVKHTAEQLWKGVTSVSNAGKKRGRGKGNKKKPVKDLNRGQIIGVGKANILWPGLSAPIVRGRELVERERLPPDPDRETKLAKMRETMGRFRPLQLSPLERGWSGTKMHGRSIGPPDPIGQDTFEGFDTKVLEMKTVANMDANYGRIRRFSVVAFTGNKNGLAGFALAKSPDGRGAVKRAKNRAGQKLLYIERYNNHTVLHDFFTQFGKTRIFVYQKPEGFGLVCHRAIKAMCEMIGIKNLYAKVEGSSSNVQSIIKAFMLGLLRQKTHNQLANEKGLFLVEQREDYNYFPKVIAKPLQCRTAADIRSDETLDYSHVCFEDRIPKRKKPYEPPWKKLPSWENHLLKTEWRRNHPEVKRYLMREYNGIKNQFTAKFPEADRSYGLQLRAKRRAERAEQEES